LSASRVIEGTSSVQAAADTVADLYARSLNVLESLRAQSTGGGTATRQAPRFPITRVAELVGRTSAAIREAKHRVPLVLLETGTAIQLQELLPGGEILIADLRG